MKIDWVKILLTFVIVVSCFGIYWAAKRINARLERSVVASAVKAEPVVDPRFTYEKWGVVGHTMKVYVIRDERTGQEYLAVCGNGCGVTPLVVR